MKKQRKLIDALIALKTEKHDILDTSTIEEIDATIALLKQDDATESKTEATENEVLKKIASVLIKLPSLIALFKSFTDE